MENSTLLKSESNDEWRDEIPWERAIRKYFLEKSGEHLIEVGITGSGKTQGLYYLLAGILDYNPKETILWITCGKSSEELKLMQFMQTNFLYPYRRGIKIETYTQNIYPRFEYQFTTIPELFQHVDKGKLNILCLAPYYPDPDEYSIIAMELFKALIVLAREGKIVTPLAVFIDEFQMFAPARGQALSDYHKLGGIWMQRNIDQLRSIGIRIVAATQSWKRVLQGVRTSFGCIMIRQGAEFPANEIKRLAEGNMRWQALEKDQMVFTFRNRFYSDPQRLPSYGDGHLVGTIVYSDETDRMKLSNLPIDTLIDSYKRPSRQHLPQEEEMSR